MISSAWFSLKESLAFHEFGMSTSKSLVAGLKMINWHANANCNVIHLDGIRRFSFEVLCSQVEAWETLVWRQLFSGWPQGPGYFSFNIQYGIYDDTVNTFVL